MTDLELTKLCAEAMGFTQWHEKSYWYEPLTNDAQAMALVKKFELKLHPALLGKNSWLVSTCETPFYGAAGTLNRAICECVAKMHLTKVKADKRFGQPHYGHGEEQ